jgi:hypothetical protein
MGSIKCVVVGDAVREPYDDNDGSSKVMLLISYTTNQYPTEYFRSVVSFPLFYIIFGIPRVLVAGCLWLCGRELVAGQLNGCLCGFSPIIGIPRVLVAGQLNSCLCGFSPIIGIPRVLVAGQLNICLCGFSTIIGISHPPAARSLTTALSR